MKITKLLFSALMFSSVLFAGESVQSKRLLFQGDILHESFDLLTDKTHTEYRTETVESTCYRTVETGSHISCHEEDTIDCHEENGRRICERGSSRRVCEREVEYGQESYTCYKSVQVAYQVFDYHVTGRYSVNIQKDLSDEQAALETFQVTQKQDSHALTVSESGKHLIVVDETATQSLQGQDMIKDVSFDVKLFDLAKELNLTNVGVQELGTTDKKLISFKIPKPQGILKFKVYLKLILPLRWAFDKVLVDKFLASNEFTTEDLGDQLLVKIDPSKLSNKFKNGFFYDTNLTVQLDTTLAHGSILNLDSVAKAKSYKFSRITF